jgi:hypothetical protein
VGGSEGRVVLRRFGSIAEVGGDQLVGRKGWTDAFAASEFPVGRFYDVVLAISRSGTTTEVADLLSSIGPAARHVALVGVAGTPVATAADDAIVLDFADERSVLQTRYATVTLVLLRPHRGEDIEPNRSITLDVDQLVQPVPDLDQVSAVRHHLVDVLVRGRDLVQERRGVPKFDPGHRLAQLILGEQLASLGPRVRPAGAVRR